MGALYKLEDYKKRSDKEDVIDPLLNKNLKPFIRDWFVHSMGGKNRYGLVILTPFIECEEDDHLMTKRLQSPKLLLVLHPIVAAWGHNEDCGLDDIMECAGTQLTLNVTKQFIEELIELDAITSHRVNNRICYQPTRRSIYRLIEIISMVISGIASAKINSYDNIFNNLMERNWVSINLPIHEKK